MFHPEILTGSPSGGAKQGWVGKKAKMMTVYAQGEVKQEESEQNEVDGMKKGVDSTSMVMHI